MAKSYAAIYEAGNDSIALEQRMYAKVETIRGTMVAPTGADFFYALQGAGVTFTQEKTSNQSRSGRHHTSILKGKTSTEWSIPALVNINTAVAAGATELDPAVALLWESMLGKKTISSGVLFDPSESPDITFSLFNCGDLWAEQVPGSFVMGCEISLPGDGQAQFTFSGNGKTVYRVGICKSVVDNNAGNDVTVAAGETYRMPVGSMVMIIEQNGTTRSADTPDGTPRRVTAVDHLTNKVTVDGAVLADADGSVTPIYLCYYEPATPVGINDPQTGLVGSIAIDTLPAISCFRNATLSLANNHELVNYCYGSEGLSGKLFVPGARLDATLSLELNLDADVLEYINKLREFISNAITLTVGSATGRRLEIVLPKVKFSVPAISVPESGSIPITLEEGMCLQTALDAGDEVQVKYL